MNAKKAKALRRELRDVEVVENVAGPKKWYRDKDGNTFSKPGQVRSCGCRSLYQQTKREA